MALTRDEQCLHKSLGSTPDTAIVLSTQSHKHKKPFSKQGMCRLHPQSTHKDEDCFVQHPDKKAEWAKAKDRTFKDTSQHSRSTFVGFSTPIHSLTAVSSPTTWVVDSGANEHCCNTTQQMFDTKIVSPPVAIHGATGSYMCTVQGSINLDLQLPHGGIQLITLSRVLYVPDLPVNLLSSNNLRSKGVFFSNLDCTFRYLKDNKLFGFALIQDGLNILQLASAQSEVPRSLGLLASHKDSSATSTAVPDTQLLPMDQPSVTHQHSSIDMTDLWHKRLGHPGLSSMRKIQAATQGLTNVRFVQLPTCEVCQLSKSERKVSRTPQAQAQKPLHKIHVDLVGHVRPETSHGHEYIVIITDDYSRYRWTFSILVKGDAHQTVLDFIQWAKVRCYPISVLSIRIDQGTEFGVQTLQLFCKEQSIELEYSAAYTPEQNGVAEASNKIILTKARSMMLDSGLPPHMWNESVKYATHIANRSASRWNDHATPHQLFWKGINNSDETVDLSYLRRFGCVVYYHKPLNQLVKSHKFAPRAVYGYLLGMQDNSSTNYRIWLHDNNRIIHTPHITFDEGHVYKDCLASHTVDETSNQGVHLNNMQHQPLWSSSTSSGGGIDDSNDSTVNLEQFEDAPDDDSSLSNNIVVAQTDQHTDIHQYTDQSDEEESIPSSPQEASYGRGLRNANRPDYRSLHRGYLATALAASTSSTPSTIAEPSSYKQALSSPQSEEWYASMQREIKQLEDQHTWKVVPELPPNRVLIKGRWVFKLKRNPDNSIKEFKSRWVAKGFMQEEGVDYFETYAATLHPGTFRTVFALVAYHGWPLYQADITGAFLHSLLQDDIYMEAPHGFYNGQICKLLKSLYGLKQAPYLWYQALAKVLETLGFLCLHADHCCFTNKDHDVFVLVFVDDLQITGPNTSAIDALRAGLKTNFALKEFAAQTFLGLQIERQPAKNLLRLHQRPYAERILEEFGFYDSKPVATPMLEQSLLPNEDDIDIPRQKWYRKVIGSLNHLVTYTRPDLAYSISCLSRHLQNPSKDHETAAKRVLRYLNGTLQYGITFQHCSTEPTASYTFHQAPPKTDTIRTTSSSALDCTWNQPLSTKTHRVTPHPTTNTTGINNQHHWHCRAEFRSWWGLAKREGPKFAGRAEICGKGRNSAIKTSEHKNIRLIWRKPTPYVRQIAVELG